MEICSHINSETSNLETKIEQDIIKKILEIESKFPELTKYLSEMPTKEKTKINAENLQEYADSLSSLLKTYAISHK